MARTLVAALAATALAAVCCGPREPPAPPRSDETLRLAAAAPPVTLDPQRHDEDLTRAVLANYYESLVEMDPALAVRPRLASGWSNPSETVWRFHLRPGVRYHDGSLLGPADVIRTLDRARSIGAVGLPADVRAIVETRTLDELTLELVTDRPRPLLLASLVQVPILPRSTPDGEIRHPIGTGPYRFEAPLGGRRFEGYWGPPPAFARFVQETAGDETARRHALETGAQLVHPVAGAVPPTHRLLRHETATVTYLFCRVAPLAGGAPSPFADVRVRQALDLLVDRPALVQAAFPGAALPAEQLVSRGVLGFDPSLPQRPPDPARARALLAQAGVGRGLRATLLATQRSAPAARELARHLAPAGVLLDVETLPWPEIYRRQREGRAPLALASWTMSTGDAASLFEPVLHSPAGPLGFGSENVTGYRNAELDALIDLASRAMRPEIRSSLLARAMRLALRDLPLIPLYAPVWGYAVRRDLTFSPRLDLWVRAADVGLAGRP